MKKNLYITIVSLFVAFFTSSCLEDEGNYDYTDLGNFYVDTVNFPLAYTTKQFSTFSLSPKLVYDGEKSDLEYKWELWKAGLFHIGFSSYEIGFSHDYTRDDYPDYTISTEEQLTSPINVIPGSYTLVFTAINKNTGLKTSMSFGLTVEGVIGSGLAVLYKGSSGIDIDMVYSPLFNSTVTETSYNRHTYTTANPSRPFAGEPKRLVAAIYPSSSFYYLYLTSTEDAVRLSTIDMSVTEEFEEMFAGAVPEEKDMGDIYIRDDCHFFVNAGVAYKCNSGSALMTPLGMGGGEYYATDVAFTYGWNSCWYDSLNGRFLFSEMFSAEIAPIVNSTGTFDLSNVGKDLIYNSNGYYPSDRMGYTQYYFFKNPIDDGSRYLYALDVNNTSASSYTALCAIELSNCPEIAQARYFATGERGPVVFYATDSKVYRMSYSIDESTASAEEVWTPVTADEIITHMELFKNAGIKLENSAQDKYLLVATYQASSGKGKIYVIESDISNGVLQETPVAVYEFDGKIADCEFINQ